MKEKKRNGEKKETTYSLKKQEYLKQMMEVYKQQHFLNLNQIKQDDLEDVLYEMLKKEIYPPYISQSLIQEIKKQTPKTGKHRRTREDAMMQLYHERAGCYNRWVTNMVKR